MWLSGSVRTPNKNNTPRTKNRTAATMGANVKTMIPIGAATFEATFSGFVMA